MLKGYKEYRETEIPWLQEMPSHWYSQRAKTMYIKMNRPVAESDDVVTCFRDGLVTLRKNRRTTGFTESIKEIGYQGIKKGDLVIHVMDAFAGAIGVSDSNGKGTPVYSVCTAKGDYNNYYYAFIVREMAKKGFIQSLYRGIRERSSDFRYEVFGSQLLPIPPRSEQDQIVRYLDRKVSMINKYINAKKKQIEFLKEQKQAIINQAVTKGLNPKTPMRDSGIEWLGRIPAYWEVMKLKHFAVVNSSIRSFSFKDKDEVVFLPMENINTDGSINNSVKKRIYEVKTGYSSFAKNDVIIAKITPCFENGKGAFLGGLESEIGFGTTELINLRARKNMLPEYLYWITMSSQFRILGERMMTGTAGQKRITTNFVSYFTIAIPDILEQKEIILFIKKNIQTISRYIDSIDSEIRLLQEYRTRLISDVVTGRVNVQGIKVPEFENIDYQNNYDSDEEAE
jgi:type I restriction enzyme S subunit